MASFFPAIGSWYQEITTSQLFEVIAVDEKYGTIEVQYEDGDLAEFDTESWGQLSVVMSATPSEGSPTFGEDPYDIDYMPSFSGNPLEDIEPDSFSGFDDLF